MDYNEMFILKLSSYFDRNRKEIHMDLPWVPSFITQGIGFVKGFFKIMLLVFWFFFPLAYGATLVFSGSMIPVVQTNEIALASQLTFGIRLSKWITPKNKSIKTFLDRSFLSYRKVQVGDVTPLEVLGSPLTFTKTIIGDEGQVIQFRNGVLFVDNEPCKLEYVCSYNLIEDSKDITGDIYNETLPNGKVHQVFYLNRLGSGFNDNTGEYIVPNGHVFGVGNNRQNSDDSRSLFAFIEKRHVLGVVFMVAFSNGNLTILNMSQWIKGLNWKRCLKWII